MRIKTYLIVASLWLMVLSVTAISKSGALTYTIKFDSDTKQSAEIKQEVLNRYGEMMRGVHEESEAVLLLHNLDLFMWEDDMNAEFRNQTLLITIGDGKGAEIHGDLVTQELCLPTVKTKSWIQEWFSAL